MKQHPCGCLRYGGCCCVDRGRPPLAPPLRRRALLPRPQWPGAGLRERQGVPWHMHAVQRRLPAAGGCKRHAVRWGAVGRWGGVGRWDGVTDARSWQGGEGSSRLLLTAANPPPHVSSHGKSIPFCCTPLNVLLGTATMEKVFSPRPHPGLVPIRSHHDAMQATG